MRVASERDSALRHFKYLLTDAGRAEAARTASGTHAGSGSGTDEQAVAILSSAGMVGCYSMLLVSKWKEVCSGCVHGWVDGWIAWGQRQIAQGPMRQAAGHPATASAAASPHAWLGLQAVGRVRAVNVR